MAENERVDGLFLVKGNKPGADRNPPDHGKEGARERKGDLARLALRLSAGSLCAGQGVCGRERIFVVHFF